MLLKHLPRMWVFLADSETTSVPGKEPCTTLFLLISRICFTVWPISALAAGVPSSLIYKAFPHCWISEYRSHFVKPTNNHAKYPFKSYTVVLSFLNVNMFGAKHTISMSVNNCMGFIYG